MRQPYPVVDESLIVDSAVNEIEWIKSFVLGVRKIRGEMNIPPGKPLPVLLQDGADLDQDMLDKHQHYLISLARIDTITWLNQGEEAPESAMALVGKMKVLIPMAGLIDKEAESARLNKEIDKLKNELQRIEAKLQNSKFVDRAPAAVVEKERSKLADIQGALENLVTQLQRIQSI